MAEQRHIIKLMLFGSVLRDDFGPKSDVDVLVKFSANSKTDLFDLIEIKSELEAIFGRPVDLVEEGSIKNPYRLKNINENLETLYAA
jgi:hypothetical protein